MSVIYTVGWKTHIFLIISTLPSLRLAARLGMDIPDLT